MNAILYATNKGNFDITRNFVILLFTWSSEVEEKTENRKEENERGKEEGQKQLKEKGRWKRKTKKEYGEVMGIAARRRNAVPLTSAA